MKDRLAFVVFGACVTTFSASTRAASIDSRVRLSLDASALSYERATLTANGRNVTASQTDVGLLSTGIGVGVGIDDHFLLGGRLLYSNASHHVDGGSNGSSGGVSLFATPEYVFSGDGLRAFVGADIGYRSVSSTSGSVGTSSSLAMLGALLGLQCSVADSFSIDPRVGLYFETGSSDVAGADSHQNGFAVTLGIAFSGWLGGSQAVPDVPAQPEKAPPSVAEPNSAQDEPETLTATVRLGGTDRIVFTADPRSSGTVDVAFLGSSTPELMACTELTLSGPWGTVTLGSLRVESIDEGEQTLAALRTTLPLKDVRQIARPSTIVTMEGCGGDWDVEDDARSDLRAFVKAVSRRARRHAAETAAFEPDREAGGQLPR